jgi:hypothetical protein
MLRSRSPHNPSSCSSERTDDEIVDRATEEPPRGSRERHGQEARELSEIDLG